MSGVVKKIGKYKVENVIAKGGMGLVYLAEHPSLKSKLIIKKLTIRGNAAVLKRFQREARILLELQHTNIVRMFDYFTEASFHCIVLEYVEGMSLDKLLERKRKLSWPLALLIVRDACKALVYAHARGIIHRDVKPGNILLSKQGGIKLTDFGIAFSEREENAEASITAPGVTLGTPAYMPPEQFSDSDGVDSTADIYALGIMFYEMLTGAKPFKGSMEPAALDLIRKGKYAPIKKLESSVPFYIRRIVRKMMRTKQKKRYKCASQLLKILNKKLKGFELHKLRVSLVKLMLLPAYIEERYESKYKKLHVYFSKTAAIIVLLSLLFLSWYHGYIHRSILRAWYTPVDVNLIIPANSVVKPDIPFCALFFLNDANTIPEVPNTKRFFHFTSTADGTMRYAIKPVYLQKGSYRVKISAGPYVWWKSIKIEKENVELSADFSREANRPLKVRTEAWDMNSGSNISAKTDFSFFYKNTWLPFDEHASRKLVSGGIWKIRAQSAGYKTEQFSLRIEWYQDELFISALLQPE